MAICISRRESLLFGAIGILTLNVRPALAQSDLVERTYGGNGGKEFELTEVSSLGLRSGDLVDAIIINGIRYGGTGGRATPEYTLAEDDYINHIDVRYGDKVDFLRFKSKQGVQLSGGGSGGSGASLSNIRVTRIGGRSGGMLDQIRIEFHPNYKE